MTSTSDATRESTADTVTDQLRADILSGRLAPGERLIEVSLCRDYECGRASLRSALVALTTEGLVEREANRGATVRRISIDEALQITQARAVLEGLIAAHAARRADDRDRATLTKLIDEMRSAVDDGRDVDYSQLNAEFHAALRTISNHTVAAELVANLRNRAAHHQFRLAIVPGRPNESMDQHAAIAAAVIEGDEVEAERAMHTHLTSVIKTLERFKHLPT